MTAYPKLMPLRDRQYLDWLREQPCIISGRRGTADETVDPAHIGTLGKGIKSPDNEALPLLHRYHALGHSIGEMTMWRENMPPSLLREMLRLYARNYYKQWVIE